MKILLGISSTLVLSLSLFLITPNIITAFAQTSSGCALIEVGTPPDNEQLPAQCSGGDGGPIVEWAQKIADNLQQGDNGLMSKMTADICNGGVCAHKKIGLDDISNKYWCTWIVLDAYELAGIKLPQDLVATGLYAKMGTINGFIKLPYNPNTSNTANLQQVKPGYAIGFGAGENTGSGGHIGLVKSIQVDDRGDGQLVTLESNSNAVSHTWQIAGGVIKKNGKPIFGFVGQQ